MDEQFALVYAGRFSFLDTEDMASKERRSFYFMLDEVKRKEREEYAKAKAKSSRSK